MHKVNHNMEGNVELDDLNSNYEVNKLFHPAREEHRLGEKRSKPQWTPRTFTLLVLIIVLFVIAVMMLVLIVLELHSQSDHKQVRT